jgi:hypothetical protein
LKKKFSPVKRPFFKFSDTKNNSRKKVKKLLKIKKCFKLSEIMVGSGINLLRIPDPGGKKVPDPGSATLPSGFTTLRYFKVLAKNPV